MGAYDNTNSPEVKISMFYQVLIQTAGSQPDPTTAWSGKEQTERFNCREGQVSSD